jgi:hypothetical protein
MIKIGDKVKSNLSLWKGDIGTVSGIIPIWSIDKEDCKIGDYVHVIFPETDKHYSYQQSFDSKNLIKILI